MSELRLLIESDDDLSHTTDVLQTLGDDLRTSLNLRIPIEIVPAGTLPRFEFKSRRWVKVPSPPAT